MKENSKELVRSTWAGHEEKTEDEKLAKIPDAQKVERKWRRRRPKLRWGGCIKSYIESVGEEWGK